MRGTTARYCASPTCGACGHEWVAVGELTEEHEKRGAISPLECPECKAMAGTAPLPDTFKDGAEALCDGSYQADGTFEAKTVQAKCASKYEAEYGNAENAEY